MDKLCLIKPWKLRTVRLKLDNVRDEPLTEMPVPCNGPTGEWLDISSNERGADCSRFHIVFYGPYTKPYIAPVSDVIFASVNNLINR